MRAVLVANPKGGAGKTTLATNLSGYFSNTGRSTTLCDLDRQQSALRWMAFRSPDFAALKARLARIAGSDDVMPGLRIDRRRAVAEQGLDLLDVFGGQLARRVDGFGGTAGGGDCVDVHGRRPK